MQYPHDLGNVIPHPIKNHVRACNNRSEPRSHFIPGTPGKRVILYWPQCVADFTDNCVRPLPARAELSPNFGDGLKDQAAA
jgi:hypothetical protein